MKLNEIIKVLEDHNVWRKGAETAPTNPEELTKALDRAVSILKDKEVQEITLEKYVKEMAETPFQLVFDEPKPTLRDRFAMEAINGFMTQQHFHNRCYEDHAKHAYLVADEMLKQRKI